MEPWIPKCMVIFGAANVSLNLCILTLILCGILDNRRAVFFCTILAILIAIFQFAWLIASSYWVFKEWSGWDKVKDDASKGCHNLTYLFMFSVLIIYWVTLPCQNQARSCCQNQEDDEV